MEKTSGISVASSFKHCKKQLLRHAAPVCIVVAYFVSNSVCAQVSTPPAGSIIERRPSDERPPLPEFEKPEVPQLQLPPVKPAPEERAPFAARVFVRQFDLIGNTVFSDEELREVTVSFENRQITNEELQELRQRLTLYYVNRGYINSGTMIPDQKVADGIIQIQIIEGRLARIDIEGVDRFRPDYFRRRLALGAGPPLNVKDLEERLQILLQSPLVDRINAQLAPGDRPGEAILRARVFEKSPYELQIGLDNELSPSIGEARLFLQGSYRNLAGRGDVLSGEVGFAEGLDAIGDDLALNYTLPITVKDTTLSLRYDKSESEVVEEPFDAIDVESESETIGIELAHPLYRTPNKQFTLGFALERRSSDTFLLDIPFSFSPGAQDGESDVAVLRFSQDWLSRSQNQVMAARSAFSFGIDAFGATINDNTPDSEFLVWLGQFQWARRLGDAGHQIIFRADIQLSDDPLLPLEKFAVGGIDSVRGYRQNQLVRDEGYAVSFEFRMPIFRSESGQSNLQLAAFVDAGRAENKDAPNPDPDSIESIGLGILWNPHPKFHAELYWAEALDDIDNPSDTLQDDGVHFRLVGRVF
ncbi:MAG: ShlB/FhaC/HecB family hemolysin secretion/activation protein [Alphaproteobacteria bacterium]|nr:ShlB/FhaC/HecB family hemolysin secretion/activation protein [Alphaproteobacteria bacterium]